MTRSTPLVPGVGPEPLADSCDVPPTKLFLKVSGLFSRVPFVKLVGSVMSVLLFLYIIGSKFSCCAYGSWLGILLTKVLISEGISVPGEVFGTEFFGRYIKSSASWASVAAVPAVDVPLFKLISVSPSTSTLPPVAFTLIAPAVAVK